MALRIRFAKPAGGHQLRSRILWYLLAAFGCVALVGICVFTFFYIKYTGVVNERLKQPIFANTAQIYAAPREVRPGQKLSVHLIANELREAGYTADGAAQPSPLGTYSEGVQQITVHPGPQSFHAPDSATIHVSGGVVEAISDERGQSLSSYELEPLLITGLSEGAQRTKRRLLTYDEIPPNLVHAVIAIEDRRFFEHGGIDYWRILGAMRNDIFHLHRYREGASTLTQQLARGFFLTPEQTYSRKMREAVISIILEHRFDKKQIFAMYANEINLGQLGSFSVDGFGEASQAYFGKDVGQLDLAECALLAGIIQSPSRLNPFRHADRAIERRNLVLDAMVETGAITKEQAETAKLRAAASQARQRRRQRSAVFCRPGTRSTDATPRRSRLQSRRAAHLHLARSRLTAHRHLGSGFDRSRCRRVGRQSPCARQKAGQAVHISAGGPHCA